MQMFTRVLEVEAEQFRAGNMPPDLTIVQVVWVGDPKVYNFLDEKIQQNREIYDGDWVVKFPDGVIEIYSPEDFELRFAGYNEVKNLKRTIDGMAVTLGGVAQALDGNLDEYKGDIMIEKAVMIRKSYEHFLIGLEKLLELNRATRPDEE